MSIFTRGPQLGLDRWTCPICAPDASYGNFCGGIDFSQPITLTISGCSGPINGTYTLPGGFGSGYTYITSDGSTFYVQCLGDSGWEIDISGSDGNVYQAFPPIITGGGSTVALANLGNDEPPFTIPFEDGTITINGVLPSETTPLLLSQIPLGEAQKMFKLRPSGSPFGSGSLNFDVHWNIGYEVDGSSTEGACTTATVTKEEGAAEGTFKVPLDLLGASCFTTACAQGTLTIPFALSAYLSTVSNPGGTLTTTNTSTTSGDGCTANGSSGGPVDSTVTVASYETTFGGYICRSFFKNTFGKILMGIYGAFNFGAGDDGATIYIYTGDPTAWGIPTASGDGTLVTNGTIVAVTANQTQQDGSLGTWFGVELKYRGLLTNTVYSPNSIGSGSSAITATGGGASSITVAVTLTDNSSGA